jgi:aminopeptidase N
MRFVFASIGLLILSFATQAQQTTFSRQDTLRGSITPERVWWDLTHYDLNIKVDPTEKFISGYNTVKYKVLSANQQMQIDLQEPMKITKILEDKKEINFEREGNVFILQLKKTQEVGALNEVTIYYEGNPTISPRPPWSGGFTWKKDREGNDFITTSCQGDGASMWWPCKDHMYDEPENMSISITTPKHLMDVSNGRLKGVDKNKDGTKTYHWYVDNPINNYGVNINIADYAHFSEVYDGEKGKLDCDYYVLKENLEKAKVQFKDASRMLKAFEHWFGPYPFYEDGFKLVEVPYLGMEHQSSVTYGNGYQNGYSGTDLSGTGWGMKFDFIIVHEAGHEWFANNITNKDIADMWIHESFTAYSENLFLDYHYGTKASNEYVIGTRARISNDSPIIGTYNVNNSGSSDMYYKGANMIHMIRQIVNDDEKWRMILRGMNEKFYHQTVTTEQIENYLSESVGKDLQAFFDQYLRDTRIPTLEYLIKEDKLTYRWTNCNSSFDMPIKVTLGAEENWLSPTKNWKQERLKSSNLDVSVDKNFYVSTFNLLGK